MRKIAFVSAPMSSTKDERDELSSNLARFGANSVVLREDWKLSIIDVDPGFEPGDYEPISPVQADQSGLVIVINGNLSALPQDLIRATIEGALADTRERIENIGPSKPPPPPPPPA